MTIAAFYEDYAEFLPARRNTWDWDPPCPDCGEQPDICGETDCSDWRDLMARPAPTDPYGAG